MKKAINPYFGVIKRLKSKLIAFFTKKRENSPSCFNTNATWYPVSYAENCCADCVWFKECTEKDGTTKFYKKEK